MRLYFLVFISIIFTACSNKYINIKTLEPSKVDEKIKSIYIEDIQNDNIKLKNYLENEIVNKKLDSEKLFLLKEKDELFDAKIKANILSSKVYSDFYFQDSGTIKCLRYITTNDYIRCIEYGRELIPCQRKDFELEVEIKVFNQKEKILFSKVYEKTKIEDRCYRFNYLYSPFFYNYTERSNDIERYNSRLAKKIAIDFTNDISVHYRYYKIKIIDTIKSIELDNSHKKIFDESIQLLENKNYIQAKNKLLYLNKHLKNKSWEIYYNLAILSELNLEYKKAKTFYEKAKEITASKENKEFLDKAINNLLEIEVKVKKAKLQLDKEKSKNKSY